MIATTLTSEDGQDKRRAFGTGGHAVPRWVLLTDEARLADPSALIARLPRGSAVIVRDRDSKRATDTVAGLRQACRSLGILLSQSVTEVPKRLAADGLHIPEHALKRWRRIDVLRLQPALLTTSAHTRIGAVRAFRLGADAVLLSPVFPTASHPGRASLGLWRFAAIARTAPLPVIALGGITYSNARQVQELGAAGIAGIGLFAEAPEAR